MADPEDKLERWARDLQLRQATIATIWLEKSVSPPRAPRRYDRTLWGLFDRFFDWLDGGKFGLIVR